MQIYYYFPLRFDYRSAQTIQVVQDYRLLQQYGYQVNLFGTYDNEAAFKKVRQDIPHAHLLVGEESFKWARDLLRWCMLGRILCDRGPKVIVSRNYNKMREVLWFKPLLGDVRFVLERHEDALPYLLKKDPAQARKEKANYTELLKRIDGLLLTNQSQQELSTREAISHPRTVVLPNGVDPARFSSARRGSDPHRLVVTYAGQFTRWKNLPLLFQALTHLDRRFVLRIAGGKDDEPSRSYIEGLISLYGLQGRVENLGFLAREKLISEAFSGSSALLLPLGDNVESRYLTSPMKLFEYMATPIPVVAVDYPSVRSISGEDTIFLASTDPAQFARAIRQAVAEPVASARLGRMQSIAAQYSFDKRSERYHQFLQSLFRT